MKQISLRTDPEVYEQLKLICIKNKKNIYDVITDMMKKYVFENKDILNSIGTKPIMELPEFFGDTMDWFQYVKNLDKANFEKMAFRNHFLKYLLEYYVTQNGNGIELYHKFSLDPFKKSSDFEFLTKHQIYSTVHSMRS